MRCPFCGNETNEKAKFCTSCGKQIPRCPTCGKAITKRTRFCTADGTPIPEEILALLPEQPAPQPAAPQNTCARCGKPAAEGRKLCDDCRAALLAARNAKQAETAACARCGQPAEAGQQYCAKCRRAIEAMQGATVVIPSLKASHFCTQCGQSVEEGQHICADCQAKAAAKAAPEKKKKKKKGGMIALAIVLVVLVLGLVGVLVYAIAAGDLLSPPSQSQRDDDRDDDKNKDDEEDPKDGDEEPTGDEDPTEEPASEEPATEAPEVPCTDLVLLNDADELIMNEANQVVTLNIAINPSHTTDTLSFASGNTAVATVDEDGRVTAVGAGETVITVTCGSQTLKVGISCNFVDEDDPLVYFVDNCDSIYFTAADLDGFDKEMARIARNAVFAKSGRKFNDTELQAYYEQFDWYEPKYEPASFDTNLLNSIQQSNLALVTEYESARGWR